MAALSYWDNLSDQDRSASIGDPRSPLCSHFPFAWSAQGVLLQDWNEKFHPTILQIIAKNYSRIRPRSGVDLSLGFHLCLLARAQDPAAARPTVVILSNKKTARKARKVIQTHDLFLRLNTGFEITFEGGGMSIFFRGKPRVDLDDQGSAQILPSSLCGVSVIVRPLSVERPSSCRQATIGGVVQIGQRLFALLPAHAFYPELCQPSSESDNKFNNKANYSLELGFEEDGDLSSSDSDDIDSDDSGYLSQGDEVFRSKPGWSGPPPKHGVYLNIGPNQNSDSEQRDNIQPVVDIENLALIGHMDPQCALRADGSSRMICTELDYALAEIEDTRFLNANRVITPSGNVVTLNRFRPSHQSPTGKVFIASGVSGVQETEIMSTASGILFPWSSSPRKAWEVKFTLAPGDCGSWVFDQDGYISGIAVATVPSVNITYVIPAADIFENIITTWDSAISIDCFFPSERTSNVILELDSYSSTPASRFARASRSHEWNTEFAAGRVSDFSTDNKSNLECAADPEVDIGTSFRSVVDLAYHTMQFVKKVSYAVTEARMLHQKTKNVFKLVKRVEKRLYIRKQIRAGRPPSREEAQIEETVKDSLKACRERLLCINKKLERLGGPDKLKGLTRTIESVRFTFATDTILKQEWEIETNIQSLSTSLSLLQLLGHEGVQERIDRLERTVQRALAHVRDGSHTTTKLPQNQLTLLDAPSAETLVNKDDHQTDLLGLQSLEKCVQVAQSVKSTHGSAPSHDSRSSETIESDVSSDESDSDDNPIFVIPEDDTYPADALAWEMDEFKEHAQKDCDSGNFAAAEINQQRAISPGERLAKRGLRPFNNHVQMQKRLTDIFKEQKKYAEAPRVRLSLFQECKSEKEAIRAYEEQVRKAAEQAAREQQIRKEAAEAALKTPAKQAAAEKKIADEATAAAKTAAEKEAADAAAAAAAEEKAKRAQEVAEAQLKEAEEAAAKAKAGAEEAEKKAAAAAPVEKKPPVRFKDAIGRNYNFPWERCCRWRVSFSSDHSSVSLPNIVLGYGRFDQPSLCTYRRSGGACHEWPLRFDWTRQRDHNA